ncbi:MAG: hypothetical protein PG981_000836 [Wolbachia endosymbiont of Ctenocephalides orientis wCori]|nr:MAG: hypothetical protein PG981_000836 [Wolbachia endosymbiont of Ctenocephalides orientis wCori]
MTNEYIELWTKKHGESCCDYMLSRMKSSSLNEVAELAKNILLDGKRTKNIELKQDHLALSNFTLSSGVTGLFASLLMPIFFKNGSIGTSALSTLTVFISSIMSRKTLVNIKDLETYASQQCNISITKHEVNAVTNALLTKIRSYPDPTPYVPSRYIKHQHIKNLSKLMRQADISHISSLYNDEQNIKSLLNEIFSEFKCSKEIKIYKQSKNLSLKIFVTGLFFVCLSLLCDKAYKASEVPELSESYVPAMVGGVSMLMALYSLVWYLYDEILLRSSKRDLKNRLSTPIAKNEMEEVSSDIQVSSTTKDGNPHSLYHQRREEVFHIT